jgi:hypothetical protein
MKKKKRQKTKKIKLTMDNYCWQWLTRDRPNLSSERAPNKDKSKIQTELITGRTPQSGLDAKTSWLTASVVTWPQTSVVVALVVSQSVRIYFGWGNETFLS